jgi:hypothetical protein
LAECKEMYDKETKEVVERGKVSDIVTEDFRYHLGIAKGAKKMLDRVNEAIRSAHNEPNQ